MQLARLQRLQAEEFLRRYEHLGNVGLGVWHWGAIHDERLVGVVSYGVPCFTKNRGWLGQIAGAFNVGLLQLCRGASSDGAMHCTPSRLISMANVAMASLRGPLIVVAYANEDFSEIGTIYQAANFLYTGLTNPKHQCDYVIDGRKMTGWQVRRKFRTRDRHKLQKVAESVIILPLKKKHRYVYVEAPRKLKRQILDALEHNQHPYPKRGVSGVKNMVLIDGKRVPATKKVGYELSS